MNVSGGIVVLMSVLFSARAFGQSCTPVMRCPRNPVISCQLRIPCMARFHELSADSENLRSNA